MSTKVNTQCQTQVESLDIDKRITFAGKCTTAERDHIYLDICPHLKIEKVRPPLGLCILVSYRLSTPFTDSEMSSVPLIYKHDTNLVKVSGPRQCRSCSTIYTANFTHRAGCNMTFTLTIRKNLGRGPESKEWKRHF